MLPWESDNDKYRTIFHSNNQSNSQVMRNAGASSLNDLNQLQGGKTTESARLDPFSTNRVHYAQELQSQVKEKEAKKRQFLESDRKSDWAMLKHLHDNDPFGRPGAGAPIRDQFGNIITTRKKDPYYLYNPIYYNQLKNGAGITYNHISSTENQGANTNNNIMNQLQAQYRSPNLPTKQQMSPEMSAQMSLTPQILPSQRNQQLHYQSDAQIQQQLVQQQLLHQQILEQQRQLQLAQAQIQMQAQAQAQSPNQIPRSYPQTQNHHQTRGYDQQSNYIPIPTAFNVPNISHSFLQHNPTLTDRVPNGPYTTNERIRRIKADLEAQHKLMKAIEESRNRGQEVRHTEEAMLYHHSSPQPPIYSHSYVHSHSHPHPQTQSYSHQIREEDEGNRSAYLRTTTESTGEVEHGPGLIEPKLTESGSTKEIPPEFEQYIGKLINSELQEFKEKLTEEQRQIYKKMKKLKKKREIAEKDLEDFRFLLRHEKEKHYAPLTQPPIFEELKKTTPDDDDDSTRQRRRRYWLEGEERYDSLLDKYNPYSQMILKNYGLLDEEENANAKKYDFGKLKGLYNRFKYFEDELELERGPGGIRVDDIGGKYNLPGTGNESQEISSLPVPNDGNPHGAVSIFKKNQERLDAIDKMEREYQDALNKSKKYRGEIVFSYLD